MASTTRYIYKPLVKWTVKAGTTITAYKWDYVTNREVGPRKTVKFQEASAASADYDYLISGSQVPHGTFLHVYNGIFAGMIIPKAQVTVYGTPIALPPPIVKSIFDYPARYQFGQPGAPCGGRSCCADTSTQMVIEYFTDRFIPLSAIRKASGETNACSGLNPSQILRALRYFGVNHYQFTGGADALFVLNKLKNNYTPVIVGTHYGSYPNAASGRCGSYNKAEYSGRTDCSFRGPHAVIAIGATSHGSHYDIFMRDPDHNSPSRPEKPKYDRITTSQLNLTMKNLPKYTNWTMTMVLYPTKRK